MELPTNVTRLATQWLTKYNLEEVVRTFAEPSSSPRLTRDAPFSMDEHGEVEARTKAECFNIWMLQMSALYVPFFYLMLPAGHPLRASLPRVVELVRERLRSPGFLLWLGRKQAEGPDPEQAQRDFLERLGGKPFKPAKAKPYDKYELAELGALRQVKPRGRDSGAFVALAHLDLISVAARPGRLSTQPALWAELRREVGSYASEDRSFPSPAAACDFLLSMRMDQIVERIAKAPLQDGEHEANPMLVVAETVRRVQAALGLGEDGAALYLQLLALPWPTTADLCGFNAWKQPRYQAAAAELQKKKLVVADPKRKAGRDHYLPGPWLKLPPPETGIEEWKLALHGLERVGKANLRRPLGVILPIDPLPSLFERVWSRLESDDRPG